MEKTFLVIGEMETLFKFNKRNLFNDPKQIEIEFHDFRKKLDCSNIERYCTISLIYTDDISFSKCLKFFSRIMKKARTFDKKIWVELRSFNQETKISCMFDHVQSYYS